MVTVADIQLEPPEGETIVDPMTWFPSPGPFELEIGSGKGGFLLSRAKANPNLRLLGIEWANEYYRSSADRMARWQIENVRVMRTDAKVLVIRNLLPACVSVLHVYHPDPWPKKRHHKRRLVQPDFAEAAVRVLIPGGEWRLQTDHAEYFEQMVEVIGARSELVQIPWDDAGFAPGPDWAGTNFQIKYEREGRTIYRVAYKLSGSI